MWLRRQTVAGTGANAEASPAAVSLPWLFRQQPVPVGERGVSIAVPHWPPGGPSSQASSRCADSPSKAPSSPGRHPPPPPPPPESGAWCRAQCGPLRQNLKALEAAAAAFCPFSVPLKVSHSPGTAKKGGALRAQQREGEDAERARVWWVGGWLQGSERKGGDQQRAVQLLRTLLIESFIRLFIDDITHINNT